MVTTIAAILIWQAVSSQDAQINESVEKFMTEHKIVGLSVAVIKDGKSTYSKGFGFQDLENKTPTTTQTRFRLASISKPIAATCVMQLVESGKLDLDKDVRSYVPDWPDKGKLVNLRMILAHRSGIRHYALGKPGSAFKEMSTSDALKMFKDDPLLFDPGTKYSYSTHAYTVAVAAIEKASGLTYRDFLDRNIAKRAGAPTLQCEDMVSAWAAQRSKHYAPRSGKVVEDKPTENLSWKYGGGGLESTAEDLARFGKSILDLKLINQKSRDIMWTDPEKDGYALGWDLDGDHVMHGGSQQGARTYLMLNPKKKIVLVVMNNTQGNPVGTLAKSIMAILEK